MEERDYKAEFDEFTKKYFSSEVTQRIIALTDQHKAYIEVEYGRFMSQFLASYELLLNLSRDINYVSKKNWTTAHTVQYLIWNHNLKTIYSAYDRLINGFYSDSSILIRAPYEGLIKMIYISYHPEIDPYHVVAKYLKGVPVFNLTNFLKDELKVDWPDYSLMSSASHANQYEVMKEAVAIAKKGQTEPISVKIKFDKDPFELGVNQISFLVWAYMRLSIELFYNDDDKEDIQRNAMLDEIHRFMELRESATIYRSPKPYWPQVYQDVIRIINTIPKEQ